MKYLTFCIFLSLIVLSCASDKRTNNQAGEILRKQAIGTYRGTLPCADCEGIQFQLILNEDNQYISESIYLGKSAQPFMDSGSWNIEEDSVIILEKQEPGQNKFAIEQGGRLRMLDQSGKVITGDLANRYVLQKPQPGETEPAMDAFSRKRAAGIDFVGIGNEPSWSLDVDFDNIMRFKALAGDSVNTPVPEPQVTGKEEKYVAETEAGSLEVSITEEPCTDNMSGEQFSHTVSVVISGKEYQGCGRYLMSDDMAYEGQWTLARINGKDFSQGNMREIPMLVIGEAENKVTGSTGCNRLNGQVHVEGDSIRFENIAITRMAACPGNFEKDFLQALNRVDGYKLEGEQLRLMQGEEELMVFNKAD